MDQFVLQNLDIADRNLSIATDLLHHRPASLNAPAYDWVIVAGFYSAVRCINAYLAHQALPAPRSHAHRARALRQMPELAYLLDTYTTLENWSREARYTAPPDAFNEEIAQIAIDHARSIRAQIETLLNDSDS